MISRTKSVLRQKNNKGRFHCRRKLHKIKTDRAILIYLTCAEWSRLPVWRIETLALEILRFSTFDLSKLTELYVTVHVVRCRNCRLPGMLMNQRLVRAFCANIINFHIASCVHTRIKFNWHLPANCFSQASGVCIWSFLWEIKFYCDC